MINKRNFLKCGASAAAASAGTTVALAAVPASLDEWAGASSWRAHVGQRFDVAGHAMTLQAVDSLASRQVGEQFSLSFAGTLPAGMGDGLYTLGHGGSQPLLAYLSRTPQGLRADFCRVQG